MAVETLQARTILRRQKRIESWFVSRYGMNLYRGCGHDCAYCDGRSEKYRVEGTFGRDIGVKANALEVLDRELDPARRRKPLRRAFVLLGGGVGDAYQPLERQYELTRGALQILAVRGWPVHVLTKSTLVRRDVDVLRTIHAAQRVVVSVSLSTVDDDLARVLEPGCAAPSARLGLIAQMADEGFGTGVYLMPVVPLLSDAPGQIREAVEDAADAGADFLIHGGMTLKPGRQEDHFRAVLRDHWPEREASLSALYPGNRWGAPSPAYHARIDAAVLDAARRTGLPLRMPQALWDDLVDENDRVTLLLDHIDFLCGLLDRPSPYGRAAHSVAQLDRPLREVRDQVRGLRGVGEVTERLIDEILDTGTSGYYQTLLRECGAV